MKFIKECDERSLPHFSTMFYGKNSAFNTAIAFGILLSSPKARK